MTKWVIRSIPMSKTLKWNNISGTKKETARSQMEDLHPSFTDIVKGSKRAPTFRLIGVSVGPTRLTMNRWNINVSQVITAVNLAAGWRNWDEREKMKYVLVII